MPVPPLAVFAPPVDPEAESNWSSVEEIQSALERLRRQKLRLEQREQQLLQALAAATRGRLRELVDAGGAPALEGMLRRAVASSRRGPDPSSTPPDTAAIHARKAPLRFRHPDDPGLVWSGRGKTPRWVQALQAQGRLDQARIAPDGA